MTIQSVTISDALTCTLSPREMEVLQLIASGMIDREIADALFVSPRTVQTHVAHILAKLHVSTRREAVLYGRDRGIIFWSDGSGPGLKSCRLCPKNQ